MDVHLFGLYLHPRFLYVCFNQCRPQLCLEFAVACFEATFRRRRRKYPPAVARAVWLAGPLLAVRALPLRCAAC
jgi:hypothetical protein